MATAIVMRETGGPEVLRVEEVEVPPPAEGEVQVRHTAIGLNFIDVYDRTGLYPVALPAVPGREAAGVVMAIGRKTKGFRVGERVAYALPIPGAYTGQRNVSAARVVKLPKGVKDETAAAIMLKGLTAHYLLRRTYRVKRGDWVLVHAAAGGVGLLLTQWARALGARVIGVVGSAEKAQFCREFGADHAIDYKQDDFVQKVKEITAGEGVDVVLDMVGAPYLQKNLGLLRRDGRLVLIAFLEGAKGEFDLMPVMLKRLTVTGSTMRPRTLAEKAAIRDALLKNIWPEIAAGRLRPHIYATFPLAQAGEAHRLMESSRHIGKIVLEVKK